MSVTKVLLDILIVLLAAKVAAEVAERVNVPAVVGEIVAGVIIGSEGTVSPLSIAWVIFVAVLFLLVTSAAGVRLAPGLFAAVARLGRSSGTLLAIALAFTLAVSELASAAKLAPIVGAFVAG